MGGEPEVIVAETIDAVPAGAYDDLAAHCGASAYYDRRFLRAAERHPLLPIESLHYLLVRDGDRLDAFMPVYCHAVSTADPLGLLSRTASAGFHSSESALFSHVMHCCDTRLLLRDNAPALFAMLMDRLERLARDSGVPQFAIANVADPALLAMAEARGMEINYSVDRYQMDLAGIDCVEDLLVRHIPAEGRHEIRRQRRKLAEYGVRVEIEAPPFARIEEVGRLCHETTARRGTPGYLPADALARFLTECGSLLRIVSIYHGDRRIGVSALLLDRPTVHLWLAGMDYALDTFSPYTVTFDTLFHFAFEHGFTRMECGRLNERTKQRFGFTPRPLHAIVQRVEARPGRDAKGAPSPAGSPRHDQTPICPNPPPERTGP